MQFTPKPFSLKKKSLSLYIRTGCERQCRLSLYSNTQRKTLQMAPTQNVRAGLGSVGEAGDHYQDKVVSEVATTFGSASVICSAQKQNGKNRPEQIDLKAHIASLGAYQFLIESRFVLPPLFTQSLGIDDLRDESGLRLDFSDLNPDILLVMPSCRDSESACRQAVSADGILIRLLEDDARLQLRVIDVKLASEPGAHYFAEIVYYSMALSAWLQQHGYDDRFVVAANGAVWPGSYENSALWTRHAEGVRSAIPAPIQELIVAMEADLEVAEFSVYGPRVRRFLQQDLPRLISTPWRQLAWHANFRCGGCDYLGYDWGLAGKTPDPLQCWPTAHSEDHLSRISGLTKGAAAILREAAPRVQDVAALDSSHTIFASHPNLRAKKDVIVARAQSLVNNTAGGIAKSGASAVIPSYADLKIFVTLDYDPSSAITVALSLRASWREPRPFGVARDQAEKRWGDKANGNLVFVVDKQSIEDEQREFLRFLRQVKTILSEVRASDEVRLEVGKGRLQEGERNAEKRSSYQIYLWDNAQFRHLTRLVSRHLTEILNDPELRNLAWLFPPDQLVPDPDAATRHSPISLVGDAVENHLAVPVPHYYSLYEVAQAYVVPPPPKILDLYRDPLTNLVPPERIHELWTRVPDWKTTLRRIEETSAYKTLALAFLTDTLNKDSQVKLSASIAPSVGAPNVASRMLNPIKATPEGLLWLEWTRLNAALSEVETQMFYALPAAEREARFGAAHLIERLHGEPEAQALARINTSCNTNLTPALDVMVYTLSLASRDVKIKVGDFTWALSPRGEDLFLNRSALYGNPPRLPNAGQYCDDKANASIGGAGLTQVSVVAIDRQNLLIALRADGKNRIAQIEQFGDADFRRDVMLDATAMDILSKKVKLTLEGIGQPLGATHKLDILDALRNADIKPQKRNLQHLQAHDFLYDAAKMANAASERDLAVRATLESRGVQLNDSQWQAWAHALSRRLTLIWGPPGTGKSETLRAIVRGAVCDAQKHRKPLRVLVTANNYNAVDNVLLALEKQFRSDDSVHIFRLQSQSRMVDPRLQSEHPSLCNIELNKSNPDDATRELLGTLAQPQGITIVGTVPHQIHNLAFVESSGTAAPVKSWFDFVILDEASQMDAASSTIVWSKVAPEGACVLAGDDLQLPPIQQADSPTGLESLVGSVYSFVRDYHGITPCALNVNYRSNRPIVDFTIEAGYEPTLSSHSPNLRLNFAQPLPTQQPANWPDRLPFCADWMRLLDANKPLTCLLHDDVSSGQSNVFEAQVVAALIQLLSGRLGAPTERRNADGIIVTANVDAYAPVDFWQKGVGVVAPHRSQGSRIADLLRQQFPLASGATPALITGAVDTVERYQGQQRDVIIASLGLGDPEIIAGEDEFFFDLRRFNVLISRACTKVVVLMSRSVLEHLSNDQQTLRDSRLLKLFAELYCRNDETLMLPYIDDSGLEQTKTCVMRTAP